MIEVFSKLTRFAFGYILAVLTAILILTAITALEGKSQADLTVSVLCSFRSDLSARVETSRQFLVQHPNGIPEAGLTRELIQTQLDNQERTLASLDRAGLECS